MLLFIDCPLVPVPPPRGVKRLDEGISLYSLIW